MYDNFWRFKKKFVLVFHFWRTGKTFFAQRNRSRSWRFHYKWDATEKMKYNDSYTSSKDLNLPLTIRQIVREAISTIYDYFWCRISFPKDTSRFCRRESTRQKKEERKKERKKKEEEEERKSYAVLKKDRYTLCLLYPCRGSVQASGKGGEKNV